jgi:hypothetical protein
MNLGTIFLGVSLFWLMVLLVVRKYVNSHLRPEPEPETPDPLEVGVYGWKDEKSGVRMYEPPKRDESMDMRALKVGQNVTLSEALPGAGTTGVVREVTKWRVDVQVEARIDGEDGAYYVVFNHDGSLAAFYGWVDASTPGWDFISPSPIPDLKIIETSNDVLQEARH